MNPVAPLAAEVNRRIPWLKRLMPRRFKRFVLLRFLGAGRGYITPPSRLWLERDVLPRLPGMGFRHMLFVGAAPYTWHYEQLIGDAGGTWVTVDMNPSTRVWGARRHLEVPIQQIGRFCAPGSLDAVILNGVFGFGVNTVADMNDSLAAVKAILRPGGLLLLGWNTNLMSDPLELDQARQGLLRAQQLPFPSHVDFEGETHVYDFMLRPLESAS